MTSSGDRNRQKFGLFFCLSESGFPQAIPQLNLSEKQIEFSSVSVPEVYDELRLELFYLSRQFCGLVVRWYVERDVNKYGVGLIRFCINTFRYHKELGSRSAVINILGA
ncbi:hypothetical protein GWI33_017655 [Rhynchophorus ferrugineus]|uniref:Uncharacterized protein n=1 Tax=Rhynchophorus ferrugineus TaxID=354439 RepID=A0A834HWE0_RHYFE|nr:hypothetical protein GWI33_017655 [Rhynchophorus ferrugineus]